MRILMHTGGIAATNCFIVADDSTRQAVVFDAPDNTVAGPLAQARRLGWDVVGLWLTHGHFDHLADHAVVTAAYPNAKVLIHPLDEPKLIDPTSRFFDLPFVIPPRKADDLLADGQELSIGSIPVRVIHTPGHSPGHVMFHFPTEKVLIGGDLIILNAVGRTDLPDSDAYALYASIRRIMAELPPDTRLYPGHGRPSLLSDEAHTNPFVIDAMASRSPV